MLCVPEYIGIARGRKERTELAALREGLSQLDAKGTASYGAGSRGLAQQANCIATWYQRENDQDSSQPGNAKDARGFLAELVRMSQKLGIEPG
jgi:hypothetical protein